MKRPSLTLIVRHSFLFIIFGLISACSKAPERNILLKCTGEHITTDSEDPKLNKKIQAVTSLHIGSKEVQMESTKYVVCKDLKTQVQFANDCKNPTKSGTYDFALNTLISEKVSEKYPSLKFDFSASCQTQQQSEDDEKKQKTFIEERKNALSKIQEPEQCILNATKGGNVNYLTSYSIRDNCNKLYAKQVEPYVQSIAPNLLSNVGLSFNSGRSIERPNPYLEVKLKNNSNSKIIYAHVAIYEKNSSKPDYYKVYADGPIAPFTVGTLSAVIDGSKSEIWQPNYWTTHYWNFHSVLGLSLQ